MSRWLLSATLGYAACVLYVSAFSVACALLSPEFGLDWFGGYGLPDTLFSGFKTASFAGIAGGPLFGLVILRRSNLAVSRPGDVPNWWPIANRIVFRTLAWTAGATLVAGGAMALSCALRGTTPEVLRYGTCRAGLIASCVVGFLAVLLGLVGRPAEE